MSIVCSVCCISTIALGIFGSFLPGPASLDVNESPPETIPEILQPSETELAPTETTPPDVTPTTEDTPIPNDSQTATVQALLTQAALAQTQVETETREPPQLIIDISSILDNDIDEIEKILGSPKESYHINIGDEIADTAGGESKVYQYNNYEFNVHYDKFGSAKFFQVLSGLSEEHYQLTDFAFILQRFGISVLSVPDIMAPARYAWENYHGYTISIVKDGITADSYVWTVQIYIAP